MTYEEAHMILEEKQSEMTKFRSCHSEREIAANGIAILAVEKQMPKKPKIDKNGFYFCPICGKGGDMFVYMYKCCPDCGQRLDWSKDDADIR